MYDKYRATNYYSNRIALSKSIKILMKSIIKEGEISMAKPAQEQKATEQEHEEFDLKGSLVSVLIVGLVILTSWLGVWYLFITR